MQFLCLKLPLPVRAAFLFLVLLLVALAASAADLRDLFSAADSVSPALGKARLDMAKARADYQAARGMPNPTLFGSRETVSNGSLREEEQTFGIQQPLGYLWSYAPKRAAAFHAYQSAIAAFDESRRRLQVEMVDRALAVQGLQQRILLMDTVLHYATKALAAMEARYAQGDVSEFDLHRLQTELLYLQRQRFDMLNERQQSGLEFSQISGLPETWLENLPAPAVPAVRFLSEEDAVETALRARPLLKAHLESSEAANRTLIAAKWNQLPDFSVGIGRKNVAPGFKGVTLEAQIELPLFSQRSQERHREKVAKEQADIELRAAKLQVEQEVRSCYRRWSALQQNVPDPKSFRSNLAGQDLNRGVMMYLLGELSQLELFDVLRSTLEAIEAHQRLSQAYVLTELELRYVTGLPLWENQ